MKLTDLEGEDTNPHYVVLTQNLTDYINSTKDFMKAVETILERQELTNDEIAKGFSHAHTLFTKFDNILQSINRRVQVLELKVATNDESGHA